MSDINSDFEKKILSQIHVAVLRGGRGSNLQPRIGVCTHSQMDKKYII